MGVNKKEKMIRTMGIDVGDPLTHITGMKNRRIVACTAIKKITCANCPQVVTVSDRQKIFTQKQ